MIPRAFKRSAKSASRAFTLLEVILSMAILAMLAASVYAITSSSISAARTAMDQQLVLRRLDAFLRVTRNAFLNLPGQGTITLEIGKGKGGEAESRLILGKVQGLFGMPSLGGASLMLASKARSDGTRTICMVRIPARLSDRELETALTAPGVPLLPKVRKPRWAFFQGGEWKEEWPAGSPRPELVRLQLEIDEIPDPIEAIFYIPPVSAPQVAPPETPTSQDPKTRASPTPSPGK
jgi:prepilin-type N-terminal cleavage/methylation domain-containing protein